MPVRRRADTDDGEINGYRLPAGNRDKKPLGDLDELQKPVSGLAEQTSSRSPRTFRGALERRPPFPLASLSIA
jgi:hypothetical protein